MKIGNVYIIMARVRSSKPMTRELALRVVDTELLERYDATTGFPFIVTGWGRRLFAVGRLIPEVS